MAKPWKIVDLDPSESLKVCLRKIAETRFQEVYSYEHGAIEGEDIEALHDMRVAARRLRALLKIFRDCFPKKKVKKQDENLQVLIRALGLVRELDVSIEMLETFKKTLGTHESKAVDLLVARQQSIRSEARKQMLRDLKLLRRKNYSEAFAQFLKDSL